MPSPDSPAHRVDRAFRWLGAKRAWLVVLAVATVLAGTSVGPHRALDDYVLALIARGEGGPVGLDRGSLDLFTFTRGDVAGNRALMDTGLMLPWWTDPELKISFFRPVSSFTHWLDERLFPSAVLMHLHSLAWFAALLGAVGLVYRRLEVSAVTAGVAFFLYALDDAHAPALAWLANRNALLSVCLGCLAIVAHDAFRKGRTWAAPLGTLALLAGLLAGEAAIGALGYLVAYALFLDRGSRVARALSLAPYVGTVVVWRALWARGGFGAARSGAYIDPVGDPLSYLLVAPGKLVMLVHGQFSAPPSDLAFLAPPAHVPFLLALGTLTVVVVVFVLAPLAWRDGVSRFWTVGMLLSLGPLAATFPSDRMLLFVGIGAMALLARLFQAFVGDWLRGSLRPGPRTWLTAGLGLLHGVAAPVLLPLRAAQMELFGAAHDRAAAGIPGDAAVRGQTVVVVAAPTVLFANYVQAQRKLSGAPRPRHLYVLSSASSALEIRGEGGLALSISPSEGFLYTPLERHYREDVVMRVGETVSLSTMEATVREVRPDGRPARVEFTFDGLPEAYRFVTFRNGRFVPFDVPARGEKVTLPEEDFGKILGQAAMGD